MPIVDPQAIPDDELRPWIVDEGYENEVSEAMSKFDETYSETSYMRNAGGHGDSDLDKFRHDDVLKFGEEVMSRDRREGGSNDEVASSEGVDYLAVHDDDSVGSNGGVPQMLPMDDEDDNEGEEWDDTMPLAEDEEILKLTSSLNNIDEKRFMKTYTMRLLMQREKKKRENDFRSGNTKYENLTNLKKIPTARYMPTHKTRVYKEWMDAQHELQKESMKEKAYLLDRPTTAFIDSLIDKEREILAESFMKQQALDTIAEEDRAYKTRQMEDRYVKTQKMKVFNDQKKCLDRFNKLYPDLKCKIPSSPIDSGRPMTSDGPRPLTGNSGPSTSSSRPVTASVESLDNIEGKLSPLRPLTADKGMMNSTLNRRLKPTFSDKRCDMTLVLGLKAQETNKFPSSNQDSIPSNRSAIVKYRTPREQMLDSLTVTSKAGEDEAKRKATQRVKLAKNALQDLKKKSNGSESSSGRFSRPATPLNSLGVTGQSSTNAPRDHPVFMRPPKAKVKHLRDLMRTTSGVNSRVFNKGLVTSIPFDSHAEKQKNVLAALQTKEVNETDETGDALINPGFFEAMGPDRIYLSQSSKFHSADDRHAQQLANREKAFITEADDIKKWAMESLSGGRQLFHSGGGGFHYS